MTVRTGMLSLACYLIKILRVSKEKSMDCVQYRRAHRALRWTMTGAICISVLFHFNATISAQELTAQAVVDSIDRGREFLVKQQNEDGSWPTR
ncbi:MAG TPA: hypothetical protein DDZ90_28770, partial [Planctomycetaceae bacterium]|nr:hypothetical protein [Planctomycetaceae bacterium]